jgi:hypothetical protein
MESAVLWEGKSMIDGSPIALVATGLGKKSRNAKTGGIIQTWIIRTDMSPLDAVNSGADAAICGDCPHRGFVQDGKNYGRSCYVTVFQAPHSVYKTLPKYARLTLEEGQEAFADRLVRLGAYGDPAAVPFEVWATLLVRRKACTGYTHQWKRYPEFKAFCMASCDSSFDRELARSEGWRTFRVRGENEAVEPREVTCPASKEAGEKTNCAACKACGGLSAKAKADIVIMAHGAAPKVNAFQARVAA